MSAARYAELKTHLEGESVNNIAADWQKLKPLEKLIAFKLLSANKALEVYDLVGYAEKYFLFCGLGRETIAPILEPLSNMDRGLFIELPKNFSDKMMRALLNPDSQFLSGKT